MLVTPNQMNTLNNMCVLLEEFDTNPKNLIIMKGDFNLFFDSKLDVQGGNSTIKKKSLAKFIELKESYELCDIWWIKNTKTKRFTFAEKHCLGFIPRRLEKKSGWGWKLKYNSFANEFDVIFGQTTGGICIRRKCDWYEHNEKSIFFFKSSKTTRSSKTQ